MSLATSAVPGSPAVIDFVYPTLSLLTVAILGYIARKVAKYLKGHNDQHDYLMAASGTQGAQIAENTKAIKQMLEQRERLIDQTARRAARPAARRRTLKG